MTDPASLRLIELDTGLPVDDAAVEGVPDYLDAPLREWVAEYLTGFPGLSDKLALKLRRTRFRRDLADITGMDLLRLISFALQLTTGHLVLDRAQREGEDTSWSAGAATPRVMRLHGILTDGASVYTVSWDNPVQLVSRLAPAVTAGIAQTLSTVDAVDRTAGTTCAALWATPTACTPTPPPPTQTRFSRSSS